MSQSHRIFQPVSRPPSDEQEAELPNKQHGRVPRSALPPPPSVPSFWGSRCVPVSSACPLSRGLRWAFEIQRSPRRRRAAARVPLSPPLPSDEPRAVLPMTRLVEPLFNRHKHSLRRLILPPRVRFARRLGFYLEIMSSSVSRTREQRISSVLGRTRGIFMH